MANTIGWGKATQNNDNGFGKYQNTIGAASIYAESYAGETAVVGTSAAFSYSASTFTQADADPTPTITGTTGGFFTSDAGVSFIDTSTGQIDLSASTIATHAITYIVDGVQSTQNVGITAAPYQSTRSFSFDGVNDYFEIPKNSPLSLINTNFSISIWLNPDFSHNGLLMMNYAGTNGWGVFYNSGSIRFYDAPVWTTLTTINTSQWTHILIVGDYTGSNLICYKNGVEVYNNSHTFTITESTANVFIGSERGTGFFYTGKLDEVSMWDTNLSTDAITEIYNSGAPNDLTSLTNASSSNLVAWYKMGE